MPKKKKRRHAVRNPKIYIVPVYNEHPDFRPLAEHFINLVLTRGYILPKDKPENDQPKS